MITELYVLLDGPVIEWLPTVTLLFLIAFQPWRMLSSPGSLANLLGISSSALLMVGLFLGSVAADPWFWFLFTAVHFCWIASAYHLADNHHYLIGYWCLSIGCALVPAGNDGASQLTRNAALLIGLCFLLAALSKIFSPMYRNGSFFVHEFLIDPRFLPVATFVGGLDTELHNLHVEAFRRVRSGESNQEQVPVPPRLRRVGLWLTWWTVLIEGLIAVLFLFPFADLKHLGVPLLILFILTTYTVVPVPSFGQILLIMLLALVESVAGQVLILLLAVSLPILSFVPSFVRQLILVMRSEATLSKEAQQLRT